MLNDMLEMLRDIAGDDDTEFMLDLLESYQSHTPVLLAAIEAAHSQGQLAGIEIAAHQLKSSSAMLGCAAFSVQCADLEKACKTDETDPATLAVLVEAIQQASPAVETAVKTLIQQLNAPSGAAPPARRSGFGLSA